MSFSSMLVLVAVFFLNQGTPGSQADIVKELMLNGVSAEISKLTPSDKAQAIKRLENAQQQAKGKRGQQIAFLLATLGSNYTKNRDYLIRALQGCKRLTASSQCDEDTGRLPGRTIQARPW